MGYAARWWLEFTISCDGINLFYLSFTARILENSLCMHYCTPLPGEGNKRNEAFDLKRNPAFVPACSLRGGGFAKDSTPSAGDIKYSGNCKDFQAETSRLTCDYGAL